MSDTERVMNEESLLSLEQLLDAVGGTLLHGAPDSFCFRSVATDSRQVRARTLFVPLIGENQDGHAYIPQAVENGASVVIVSRPDCPEYERGGNPVCVILVENTLRALQNAAAAYVRKFPHLIRCAVTGSSGKTTTKEIAASILRQKFSVVATEGNFNSETGLPLSVFAIRAEHQLGLFEMGMNRVDEIGEIAAVFRPEYAIITNIGTAHIGILGSRQAIAAEKKKIFRYVGSDGAIFVPADDDFSDFLAEDVRCAVVPFGINADSSVKVIADEGLAGTVFSVSGVQMRLALPGTYNFLNALAAIALARRLGVSPEQIKAGIEGVRPLGGRSAVHKGKYTVLEDCYNANPDSMAQALKFCASVRLNCRKLYVLGDMLELGGNSRSEHEKIGAESVGSGADMIVFFGPEMRAAYEAAVARAEENSAAGGTASSVRLVSISGTDEAAVEDAAQTISEFASDGDFVLLKGSRGVGLERILPHIGISETERGHGI